MKVREFDGILKVLGSGMFVGNELTISGEGEFGSQDKGNHLIDEQIVVLAEALKKNPTITKVDLGGNNIGDKGVIALAGVKSIENLDLTANYNISPIGAKALAESNVKVLSLMNVCISILGSGDETRPQFLEMMNAFIKNRNIVELNLKGCEIPNEMLALLIRQNTTIKSLAFDRYLTDKVFEFIKDNKTLETIAIGGSFGTEITDKTIEYVAQNNSLKSLYIINSSITNAGAKILATHPTLKNILLHDSDITFEGAKELLYSTTLEKLYLKTNLKSDVMSSEECEAIEHIFYFGFPEESEQEPQKMDLEQETELTKKTENDTQLYKEDSLMSSSSSTLSSSSSTPCDSNILQLTGHSNETENDYNL